MKKIVLCLTFLLICHFSVFAADEIPNVAFLRFVDNTKYTNIHTGAIVSELLLTDLIDNPYIKIIEHGVMNDAIEAEGKLNNDALLADNAAENEDFAYLIEAQQRKDISKTVRGDFLPIEDVQVLGNKYGADYILHGTIDYLGTSETINSDLVSVIGLEKTTFSLIVVATVRLIDTQTGEVIWAYRKQGASKDKKYDTSIISIGVKGFNATLFDEAIEKLSKCFAEQLQKDLETKKLILKKGSV